MRRSRMEQYLKTIHILESEEGRAHTKDLAKRLGVTQPSVSEFCRKLWTKGYIHWEPYHGARLTEKGRRIALSVEERYEVVLTFLLSLGVDQEEALDQACSMEHEISDESASRLRALMGKVD